MGNETIAGLLSVQAPSAPNSFTVLNLQTDSFVTEANRENSYFVVARDILAAPPNGAVQFSVRGDGTVVSGPIESPTITELQKQISILSVAVKLMQTQIQELGAPPI